MNLPVIYDSRLRERHFGSFQGKKWIEIEGHEELRKIDKNQQYDYSSHGGESVNDVKNRVLDFIEDIKKTNKESVLVVTSAGIIRLLHNILHGEVHEKIQNSSMHEFEFK